MKYRKHTKYIFLVLAVAAASLFGAAPALADPDDLVVEFEGAPLPLFSGANFLPSDGIERYVRVTNNTGESKSIAVEAINITDLEDFGDVLHMLIKKGSTTHFDNTLSVFFDAGEVSLSEVGSGDTAQYDFIVTFDDGAGDAHQGKTLGFDILIGFQGESGGGGSSTGGSGGGGGSGGSALLRGLVIRDEATIETAETTVTITWITSFFATSQVLYAKENEAHTLDLSDNAGSPPTYGYAHTTPETDENPKVTSHSVTITGLAPGTTYFYRAVSRASPPTIGREHTFTTLTVVELKGEGEKEPEEGAPGEGKETGTQLPIPGVPEGEVGDRGQEQGPTEITRKEGSPPLDGEEQRENGELPEELAALPGEEEPQEERFGGLGLAAIGGIFKELDRSYLLLALFIIGIAALFVISRRKRRKRKERG